MINTRFTTPARQILAAVVAVAAAGLAICLPTHAAPSLGDKELVRQSFEAWAARTGSPYDLLATDASWTIVGRSAVSKTYSSRAAFLSEVIRPFNARMREPLVPAIREMYADGNTVIVLFDASGTARDGEPYHNTYTWFLQMSNGKIVRATAFFDSIAFDELWNRIAPSPDLPQ